MYAFQACGGICSSLKYSKKTWQVFEFAGHISARFFQNLPGLNIENILFCYQPDKKTAVHIRQGIAFSDSGCPSKDHARILRSAGTR
jgi:hypothetical protein